MEDNYYSRHTEYQGRANFEGSSGGPRRIHEYNRKESTGELGYPFKSFSEMTLNDAHRPTTREYPNYSYESRGNGVSFREGPEFFGERNPSSYPIPSSHYRSSIYKQQHTYNLDEHVYSKSLGAYPNNNNLFKGRFFSPEGQSDNEEPTTNIPNTPPPSSEGSPNYYRNHMHDASSMLSTSFPTSGSFQFINDKNLKTVNGKPGQSRAENWSYEETTAFIEVLLSLQQQFQRIRQFPKLWVKISQGMSLKGYNRSVINCRNRWKVLVTKYRKAYAETVEGKRSELTKNFEFYDVVGNLLAPNYSCQEDGQIIRAFKSKYKSGELKKKPLNEPQVPN